LLLDYFQSYKKKKSKSDYLVRKKNPPASW
jgi:hypothetical protein